MAEASHHFRGISGVFLGPNMDKKWASGLCARHQVHKGEQDLISTLESS